MKVRWSVTAQVSRTLRRASAGVAVSKRTVIACRPSEPTMQSVGGMHPSETSIGHCTHRVIHVLADALPRAPIIIIIIAHGQVLKRRLMQQGVTSRWQPELAQGGCQGALKVADRHDKSGTRRMKKKKLPWLSPVTHGTARSGTLCPVPSAHDNHDKTIRKV